MTDRSDSERHFLEQSVDRFSGWIEFADAKAGGGLLLFALGFSDLIGNAGGLVEAHSSKSIWGCVASVAFWVAVVLAVVTVWNIWRSFFPSVTPARRSLFYFGDVAQIPSSADYVKEVRDSSTDLYEEVASQAWQLGRIASAKFAFVRRSYLSVGAFLVTWAIARLSLALS